MRRFVFILLLIFFSIGPAWSQYSIDSLEIVLSDLYGVEKLRTLNELVRAWLPLNAKNAVRYGRQAKELSDNIIRAENQLVRPEDHYLKPVSYHLLGIAYYQQGKYLEAKETFEAALSHSELIGYDPGIEQNETYLTKLDSIGLVRDGGNDAFWKKKIRNLGLAEIVSSTSSDFSISANIKLANNYEKNGNYLKAIESLEKAINLLTDKGEGERVRDLRERVADLQSKAGNYKEAIDSYQEIQLEKEKTGDSLGVIASKERIQGLVDEINNLSRETESLKSDGEGFTPIAAEVEVKTRPLSPNPDLAEAENLRKTAIEYEQSQDFEKSLEYFKLYSELQTHMSEEDQQQELALLEKSHQIESKAREITLLKQQQEIDLATKQVAINKQTRNRNMLGISTLFLVTLAIVFYGLYRTKRKDHKKLQFAYHDLETTKDKLESAETRIKTLLTQQVSGAIATELLSEEKGNNVSERRFVCIMFLDIRGFTPFAETREPEEIIQYQNTIFGFMIDIIDKYNGIVNQFLGDGFMATFGAPVSGGNDCENAYQASLEIIKTLEQKNEKGELPGSRIGIGLHAGLVVAGNVGTQERMQYSITGNTVIIAARIEQLTKQHQAKLLITREVYDHLESGGELDPDFTEVQVKGRQKPISILKVS